MKKTYSKPSIYIETFALSEHIADSCGAAVGVTTHGNGAQTGCYYTVYLEDGDATTSLNLFADASYCSPESIDLIGEDGTLYLDVYDYNGTAITMFFSS